MTVAFTKMHGAGNDFVCLDALSAPRLAGREDLGELAVAMCDRRLGIGGDGLLVICAVQSGLGLPADQSVRMRMFNADGTESSMCGNGLRCVARYVIDHGLARTGNDNVLLIQTGAGVIEAMCPRDSGEPGDAASVTVNMGPPNLELETIPVDRSQLAGGTGPVWTVKAGGAHYNAVFVSMGNPHAVMHVEDAERIDLSEVGPLLERHPAFPERINAHFVEVIGPGEVRMRTWERGSGITGACGSGACAVCVAGVLAGVTGRSLRAHLPGGDLQLQWSEPSGPVHMTGPAVEVFSGQWPVAPALQTTR